VIVASTGTTVPVLALDGDLPEGEGREVVERVCGDCHGVDLVASQVRTRTEWQLLVEEMIGRGAAATADDQTAIISYAFTHFGRVNVNRATEDDLVVVLRVTSDEAKAIVNHRSRGEFRSLDDLRQVPGLDSARIDERKQHVAFTGT
jgi:competence protein ComEA